VKALAYSSLFPTKFAPLSGVFVRARLRALASHVPLEVLAPVLSRNPAHLLGAPDHVEKDGELVVHTPRFFNTPRYGKRWDAALMERCTAPVFRELVEQLKPTFIDAHWAYPDGVAAARLARKAGLPYAITIRGDDISTFLRTPSRRPQILEMLNGAAAVIGVCQALIDDAREQGMRNDHAVAVGNGVDVDLFRPEPRRHARERLGIPEGRLVLSVGFINERKGFHLVVEAMARLADDVQLVIVGGRGGEDYFMNRLLELRSRFGLEQRVHFVGSRRPDQLRDFYSAADVFCLASSREGWPNVLLESLACGCPVVATNVWGIPEVIHDDTLGVLVERSVESIAAGLDQALNRDFDRDALVAHARTRTWDDVAQECVDVYRRFI